MGGGQVSTVKKAKQKRFTVMVDIKGQVNVDLYADSLNDAVERVSNMEFSEIMEDVDHWNDYEFEVSGVFK